MKDNEGVELGAVLVVGAGKPNVDNDVDDVVVAGVAKIDDIG